MSVHLSGEVSGTYASAELAARDCSIPVHSSTVAQLGMGDRLRGRVGCGGADAGQSAETAADAARERAAATKACSTSTHSSTCDAADGSVLRRRWLAPPSR